MADFQYPDLLGQYVRGQMAPGEIQAQQQQNTEGGLRIDQLRLALGNQQMYQDVARQGLQSQGYLGGQNPQGPQTQAAGAQSPGGPTGGVQNGPQGAVGGTDSGVAGFTPTTLGALALLRGDDPLKTAQGVQDYQLKQKQIQAQGPMNLAESVASDPNADKIIMNNPSLQQQWISLAPKLGLNPFTDMTPENARRVATFGYNQLAGSAGLPPKPMPTMVKNVNLGQGEVGQIDPLTGKKVGDLTERQNPSYSLVDKWDPNTNTSSKVPVQTGGYGMQGVKPGGQTANTPGYNIGMKPPSDPELKAAMFGGEMRAGLQKVRDLEGRGVNLSPKARAAFINAATSEDSGMLAQFMGQEALAHGLSKNEQTYMAALMPMLQAAGHDQSGARLSTGQVRQNLESMIPIDVRNKEALDQVNANRNGFYQGLLTQAGSATQLPQYRGTLAADLKGAQSTKTVTSAQVQDYATKHHLSVDAATQHVKSNGFTVQ
jgi:hypothetical protein